MAWSWEVCGLGREHAVWRSTCSRRPTAASYHVPVCFYCSAFMIALLLFL